MASKKEIERHYDILGPLHALRMQSVEGQGNFPDYTCAFFDGDFSKTHGQAQRDKHTWIFDNLGLGQDLSGKRVLDIGCGWGPMLQATRERGGSAVGLTLASCQVAQCKENGLDARLRDYKTLGPNDLGAFDGIVSLGAFEHFCSIDEMLHGKQDAVYKDFFRICAEHLRPGGRLYLQTMTWGKKVPDYRKLSLTAPKDSMEAILARMEFLYPGSWLPNSLDQLIACASEHFDFVMNNNGRRDYIETLKGWDAATSNLWKPQALPRTLRYAIPLAYGLMTSRGARIQMESVRRGDQANCFKRQIMSHERAFFVKKSVH